MPVVRSHWPVVGPGGVVSLTANGGTLVFVHPTDPALARVQVGIDAAVVADHHVTIRATLSDGQVQLSRFHVPPTIAGLSRLGERLSVFPGVVAVAEPTSMTWLGLHVALQRAGCDLSLVGTRHSARLRGAISGKLKSDVIDADVLSLASDVFALSPLDPPLPAELALRRAVVRRGKLVIDGNRARRRLISLARWAFPDVWTAFAGSWPTAIAVLTRWPDLRALAAARRSSVTAVVAAHTRGVAGVAERAGAIRVAAAAWVEFWDGRLDLEALAWETAERACQDVCVSGFELLVVEVVADREGGELDPVDEAAESAVVVGVVAHGDGDRLLGFGVGEVGQHGLDLVEDVQGAVEDLVGRVGPGDAGDLGVRTIGYGHRGSPVHR